MQHSPLPSVPSAALSCTGAIGFFDSGQGGLTLWEEVVTQYPSLNTVYLGDTARAPYGDKSTATITRYTSEAILHLTLLGCRLVVLACGTASSAAGRRLQGVYRVPVLHLVDALASRVPEVSSPQDTIAVLGTRYTIGRGALELNLREKGYARIWTRACPLFVHLVEEGLCEGPLAEAAAELYLADLPPDTKAVLLACTHFPRLRETIARVAARRAPQAVVIDAAPAAVAAIGQFLSSQSEVDAAALLGGRRSFLCSDSPDKFRRIANLFSRLPLPEAQQVSLLQVTEPGGQEERLP